MSSIPIAWFRFRLRTMRGAPLWPGVTLLVAAMVIVVDLFAVPNFVGLDFPSFYSACLAARRGVDFYDNDLMRTLSVGEGMTPPFPYLYPPVLPYLLRPMLWLRPVQAQRLWTLATALALCAVTFTTTRALRARDGSAAVEPLPWPLAVVFAIGLALALNFRNVVVTGQVNLFVLALMCPAIVSRGDADRRDGDGHLAALAFALAMLIKTTPALFLGVFLVRGRWRLVVRIAGWTIACTLLSLLLGAAPAWRVYIHLTPRLLPGNNIPGLFPLAAVYNFSLFGFFARMVEDPTRARHLATASAGLMSALLLAVAYLARTRGRDARDDGEQGLVLATSALMIAAAPLAYVHHTIFLFPALFWLLAQVRTRPSVWAGWALALGLLIATDFPGLYGRLDLAPDHGHWIESINLYGLILLYALGLRLALPRWRRPALAVTAASPA